MLLRANSLTVGSPADSNGMDPAQCSKIARQDLINAFALASEAFMIWSRRLWASRRFDVCHENGCVWPAHACGRGSDGTTR